jgi:hypothetical protein
MKTIRFLLALFTLVAMIGILPPSAKADDWNKKTKFTFREPVQIAGTVLQPGTYWFKLVDDGNSSRFIFIIRDEKKNYIATVVAFSNSRRKLSGHTTIGYWETPRGTPLALRSWFYPATYTGYEFPYPS